MKRKSNLILSAVLVLPLIAVSSVRAEETMDTRSDEKTETTQTTENKKKTGNEGLTLQQRLDKRKTEVKTRLNALEKTRLQTRCKAAQGNLSSLKGRITGIETSRTEVYGHLVERLTNLQTKLKAAGLDTAALEQQIMTLQTKIDTFNTDLATYKEAVSDLAGMDCASDPDAFKASLETARTLRQKLVQDGKDIKAYLSDTIKPTLQTLRSQLEAKRSGSTGQEDTEEQ